MRFLRNCIEIWEKDPPVELRYFEGRKVKSLKDGLATLIFIGLFSRSWDENEEECGKC